MRSFTDLLLVFVVLTNLLMLGSNRLTSSIRLCAVQGIALGLMPPLLSGSFFDLRLLLLAVAAMFIKGYFLPQLLLRAIRSADVRHEDVPIVSYAMSIMLGVVFLGLSFWMSRRFPLPSPTRNLSPLVLPLALSTILIGLFLIISRRTAVMQVIGYLVLENGIFIFGVALAQEEPFLVEMGVLLDVFVAVFVMGIAIFHISREFDHIDVDQLTSLKD